MVQSVCVCHSTVQMLEYYIFVSQYIVCVCPSAVCLCVCVSKDGVCIKVEQQLATRIFSFIKHITVSRLGETCQCVLLLLF